MFLDDSKYRDECYYAMTAGDERRHLSLVDRVIRQALQDSANRIDAIFTFNQRDFIDVCGRRRLKIFP